MNQQAPTLQKLTMMNEDVWMHIGSLSESFNDFDRAMAAYDAALRHNPYSVPALTQIAALYRAKEQYPKAIEYFHRILAIESTNGEIWGALGHAFLMMDDLQRAYAAYQQALYHLPNPKEPKLWYGIGILYDRYGSYEHAEEAFSAVIRMDDKFEKANEIYFRLGIIYKQQGKFDLSLSNFRHILPNPPKPLSEIDIWFQIGHVYEQQKEFGPARQAYERVLAENPRHAKVLQQLGWLYHQQNPGFQNQDEAISYLKRSLDVDATDAQTWYLLGRCYMAQQKYNEAYDAYQQAVYRDSNNPTFWCSIGVLYFQINQHRDALDAYTRAIRINPYISELWYDLGTLYESSNNQINDAMDAYQRALELDPNNPHIKQRLQMLRAQQQGVGPNGGPLQPLPPHGGPQEIGATSAAYPGPAPNGSFYQYPQQQGYRGPPGPPGPPGGPPGPMPGPGVGQPPRPPQMAPLKGGPGFEDPSRMGGPPPPMQGGPPPPPGWGPGMPPQQGPPGQRTNSLGPGPMPGVRQSSPAPPDRRPPVQPPAPQQQPQPQQPPPGMQQPYGAVRPVPGPQPGYGAPPPGYPGHLGAPYGGQYDPAAAAAAAAASGYRDRSPMPDDRARSGVASPNADYYQQRHMPQDHSGLDALASALQMVSEEREREVKAQQEASAAAATAAAAAAAEEEAKKRSSSRAASPPSVAPVQTENPPSGVTPVERAKTPPSSDEVPAVAVPAPAPAPAVAPVPAPAAPVEAPAPVAATPAKRTLDETDYDAPEGATNGAATEGEPDPKKFKADDA